MKKYPGKLHAFDAIYDLAATRQGGVDKLEARLSKPKSAAALGRIPDDRWLAEMTRSVFQAGFVWRVVDDKWPAFEAAFGGFDPHHVAYLSDEAVEQMLGNADIIRHHRKLLATRANAAFVVELMEEHNGAGRFFASFGPAAYIDLLDALKRRADRMGGTSAQYFLRRMGVDSFILSADVVKALIRAGVVDKNPGSRRDLQAVQAAFNHWCDASGRCLTHVSRILAMSIDA